MEKYDETKLMMEKFNDMKDYNDSWRAGLRLRMMLLASIKYIPNPNRRWWQFWRPRKIDNPDYDPKPVEIDIVRGGKIVNAWDSASKALKEFGIAVENMKK